MHNNKKDDKTVDKPDASVFVENFISPAQAGQQWKKDVDDGKDVAYLSQSDGYLGSTAADSDLDDWLSAG